MAMTILLIQIDTVKCGINGQNDRIRHLCNDKYRENFYNHFSMCDICELSYSHKYLTVVYCLAILLNASLRKLASTQ